MIGEPSFSSASLMGAVLLGRYRIVRELAKGGMGIVYLARAEGAVGFVKPVVVKLVLPEHASDRRFLGMFAREAQILAHLRHPSIVDVVEFGEQDGAYVMVLEYVRGYHVGQWTKFLRLKGRQVPSDIALQLMIDVLEALQHAHSMQHPDGSSMHIVHRDVSPSNILLDEDGRARLLDFGVARMRGGNADYQTQVKGFVGKLMYSAPEIFAEADSTPISDCYSCAVVLHEMLLGRNVFRGENQAKTLNRVLNHTAESIEQARPDVPRGIDKVLNKALAKSPDDRYSTAVEFAHALRHLQAEPESDVRSRLATLLKSDFNREMAELLGLESLADRDEAWRRLSHRPPAPEPTIIDLPDLTEQPQTNSTTPGLLSGRDSLRSLPPTSGPTPLSRRSGSIPPPSSSGITNVPPIVAARTTGRIIPPPPPPALVQLPSPPPQTASKTSPHLVWGVVALAALALIGWLGRPLLEGGLPSTPPPQIRVVTSAPAEVPARDVQPEPAVEQAPPAIDATPGATEAVDKDPKERAESSARRLTRAFRKQQDKIEACFKQHATSVQGMPVVQLEFDLGATGKLTSARVTPTALGSTALGQCIQKVALTTQFPAQGKAISFAIPLSATARPN